MKDFIGEWEFYCGFIVCVQRTHEKKKDANTVCHVSTDLLLQQADALKQVTKLRTTSCLS